MKQTLKNLAHPGRRTGGFFIPHITLVVLLAFLLGNVTGILGTRAVEHLARGGVTLTPETNTQALLSGTPAKPSVDLTKFIVRLHDQKTSNSCVGQTLSEMVEIEANEGGVQEPFSPAWIWNQLNGCANVGISYTAAFGLVDSEGEAPQAVMNGLDPATYYGCFTPTGMQLDAARLHVFSRWVEISAGDRASIETALSSGLVIAYATNWYSSWVDHWATIHRTALPQPSGAFQFAHSTALIGYNAKGVIVLQSWFAWGSIHQEAIIPWATLAAAGGTLVVAYPTFSIHKPAPHPFPLGAWTHRTGAAHVLPYRDRHGHLLRATWAWIHLKRGRTWGSPIARHYESKPRLMVWRFGHGTLYVWVKAKGQPLKFVRNR